MTWLILLAAGCGKRFGATKQLACVQGQALINYQLSKFITLNCPILLILGHQQRYIRSHISSHFSNQIDILVNASWQQGLSSSIKTAVNYLQTPKINCDRVIFMPLDQALVTVEDIRRLIESHNHHSDKIICSQYQNTIGSPAIFSSTYFNELKKLSGDQGAIKLIKSHKHLPVKMPSAEFDIDTPTQLQDINSILLESHY